MTVRLNALLLAVALHSAAAAFILSARSKDLVSSPAYGSGAAFARPFAFGRCIPMTSRLEDEMVQSYDEAYGVPVYRCTGWRRPLLNALISAAAASLLLLAARSLIRLLRKSET